MRLPFAVALALREARSTTRRLATYMIAISIGVAALVAINSFRANVVRSVDDEAKGLLGADIRLSSNRAFPDSVAAIIDSVEQRSPGSTARVISTITLATGRNSAVRLVQLRGVYGPYPFYGSMETEPSGLWQRLAEGDGILVEPSLLPQLGVQTGDSLLIGGMRLQIVGVITNLPAEVTFRNALGPRVYMRGALLDRMNLLTYGSIARYETYIRMPAPGAADRFVEEREDVFRQSMTGTTTAREQAEQLGRALDSLGRFLGLVGLAALLLGGIGVASAVNVFIRSKRDTIAVLRCLGATRLSAFTAYLLQAAALGISGALLGAFAGLAIQSALPSLLRNVLPFDISFAIEWKVLLIGVGIGTAVTIVFAMLPLLEVRGITPLRALRHAVEPAQARDPAAAFAYVLIAAAITAISIWQAGRTSIGLMYAGGLIAAIAVLALFGRIFTRITRMAVPARARFTLRQGISSMHRPQNQTLAVIIAVGFGVFLTTAIWVVQRNVLEWIRLDSDRKDAPNIVLIDIQPDQLEDTRSIIARYATTPPDITPIVPGRIDAVNGVPAATLLEHARETHVEPWAVRREYRHTYRALPTESEQIIAGKWWSGPHTTGIPEVSVERDLLANIGAKLGEHITWDIQGVRIETVVTSVREVDWARFDTNFFVVFQPGVLENAPQTFVALVNVPADRSGFLQRDISAAHANISAIDVTSVQRTLTRIVSRVAFAIRSMALFSVLAGAFVLLAALASGRYQRARESALLRVLGATRAQVRAILLTEYTALGLTAGLAGVVPGSIAGYLLVRRVFNPPAVAHRAFILPAASLIALCAAVTIIAIIIGLRTSLDALHGTPLEVLRDAE